METVSVHLTQPQMIRLPETRQVCTFNSVSFNNGLDLHGHKVRLMSEEPVAGTSERFARGSGHVSYLESPTHLGRILC